MNDMLSSVLKGFSKKNACSLLRDCDDYVFGAGFICAESRFSQFSAI